MAPYQTVQTRDGEIRVPVKKPDNNNPRREIPYWLSVLVALSSIISSLGIVVAILQLNSNNDQFKTSNRGILIFRPSIDPKTYGKENSASNGYENYIAALHIGGEMENVGHTTLEYRILDFHYHKNGEMYSPNDEASILEDVLYPTETRHIFLPTIKLLEDGAYVNPEKIVGEKVIICSYTIEYNDIDDPTRKHKYTKVFEIEYSEELEEIIITYQSKPHIHN